MFKARPLKPKIELYSADCSDQEDVMIAKRKNDWAIMLGLLSMKLGVMAGSGVIR